MPDYGEGGKEVRTIRLSSTALVTVIILLLCCAMTLHAQILRQDDVQIIAGPLGPPCEPGELQFGFYPCPPVAAQGVLIHVRADDWRTAGFESYSVTLNYRTTLGESKSATLTVRRTRDFGQSWDDGWRAVGFNIGRVRTGALSGITVESVAIAKIPPPIVITIGKSEFSPPKE